MVFRKISPALYNDFLLLTVRMKGVFLRIQKVRKDEGTLRFGEPCMQRVNIQLRLVTCLAEEPNQRTTLPLSHLIDAHINRCQLGVLVFRFAGFLREYDPFDGEGNLLPFEEAATPLVAHR